MGQNGVVRADALAQLLVVCGWRWYLLHCVHGGGIPRW